MKFRTKTPSKNLGDSMRRSLTTSTQQPSNVQKGKEGNSPSDKDALNRKEVRIGEELDQLDTAIFESILRDVASSKLDLVKNIETSGTDPVIMGLIDDAKQRQTAEKNANDTANTKAPVKFDEVIDFIDDGDDDIVIGKPPILNSNMLSRNPNIKSPIRGNPVTDYDKINAMNGVGDENPVDSSNDIFSRLEMGHHSGDLFDENKIKDYQKNVKCDEKEQLDYMKEKGLNDYAKFDSVLGPASQGEFASFAQNLTPVIASELGVLNPVNSSCYNIFQTCTTNGRLLPAVPRKYFCTTENHPRPTHRPTPQKPPVTIMLQSAAPSLLNTTLTDSQVSGIYSQTLMSPSPPPSDEQGTSESASAKKRAKKAKKAASKATDDSEDKEDVEDEEEKENNMDDGLTDKEREARRKKNMKNKEKKKAKKLEEKKELESKTVDVPETPVNSGRGSQNQSQKMSPLGAGSGSPDESPKNQQSNVRRTSSNGGKNKKTEKGVSAEYTVGNNAKANKKSKDPSIDREDIGWKDESVGSHSLDEILKNFGYEVSEPAEKPKKNKKGNNASKKATKQQQKKEPAVKETARSPPSDNELSLDDEVERNKKQHGKKKMDEVSVAASITKRCSSGVGQSEEDDDQSYVSAQENLGGSASRLSTPPTEFADARQSRDDITENVMLDPNNYRDDEDVETLAKQLQQQEDEFITVGKNKKKNKKQASVQDNLPASSTASSSSPPNRRNSTTGQTSIVSPLGNNPSQHHQHQRNNNRPVAHPTTLGDFMESTKKDTHKNIKHKKIVSPVNTTVQKKQASLEEPFPNSPAFVDALETPISVNTAPAFSYADAAKKSSGENTPAHEMSPVPQLATNAASTSAKKESHSIYSSETPKETKNVTDTSSSVSPKFVSTTKSSAVQLPASSVAAADSDISFGYEETLEDKRRREQKEAKPVTRKTEVEDGPAQNFLKNFSSENKLNDMPKNGSSESNVLANEIVVLWNSRWGKYSSENKPRVYTPQHKK